MVLVSLVSACDELAALVSVQQMVLPALRCYHTGLRSTLGAHCRARQEGRMESLSLEPGCLDPRTSAVNTPLAVILGV